MSAFKVCFLLIVFSCMACNKGVESNAAREKTIDMKNAIEISFDSLVEDIFCIPLKKQTLSSSDCWELIHYHNLYFMYTPSYSEVSIYNDNGELIKIIDAGGKGKSRIYSPHDIAINKEKEELWISDSYQLLNKYSFRGDFKEQIILPKYSSKLMPIDSANILVYGDLFNKADEELFYLYTSTFEKQCDILPKGNMSNVRTSCPLSLFALNNEMNELYILLDKNGKIYKFENKTLTPIMSLDFGSYFLTAKKYPKNGFTDKEFSDIIDSKKLYYSINSFHLIGNYFILKAVGRDGSYYAINRTSNRCQKFFGLFDGFPGFGVNPISGSDNNVLYCVVPQKELFNFYKDRHSKYKSINKVLSDKDIDGDVIICIKLKQ